VSRLQGGVGLRPKGGGKAWIRIAERDVDFHDLIKDRIEEEA